MNVATVSTREAVFYARLERDNDDWLKMQADLTGLTKAFLMNVLISEARRRNWSFTRPIITTEVIEETVEITENA